MKVASFYRFLDLPAPAELRAELQAICEEKGLLGTILVAARAPRPARDPDAAHPVHTL